uniref:No apical meristem-associated C-terminal domain-containing protein n=1 Tax=Setaria italica TaxID=4555 RepID=K3ZF23_SETIT
MSRRSKRTSAPTPMEVPPLVAQSGQPAMTQPAPLPSIPSMFGPGQPGMASSAAQGRWWAPAGVGASAYPWSGSNNLEESDVQECRPQAASNGSSSQAIHIDDDNNDCNCSRTEKRLTWTKEEDLRLVSAWVNNSNNPIQSNFKKNDQYWKGVAYVFNSTTPKKPNGPFMFRHCWEVLCKEPKWEAYLERLEDLEPDKRKFSVDEDVGKHFSLDDSRDEWPIGGKKAKEQMKKRKKEQPCIIDLEDELNNFLDAHKTANEGRNEMLETQRRVSSENLEARTLAHLVAKEHKESVMLETYQVLLMKETTGMPEDVKSEHVLALKCLREKLFNKND